MRSPTVRAPRCALVAALAAGCVCAAPGSALAGITFSFADPGPGRQLMSAEGAGDDPGFALLTYDTDAPIVFIVDGSMEGLGVHKFDARLEMSLQLGPATVISPSTLEASTDGTFTFYTFEDEMRVDIVTGSFKSGRFFTFDTAGAILATSEAPFGYVAGPALQAILGGLVLANDGEAAFTVTDIESELGGFINEDQTFRDFNANASFSGLTSVVPAAGGGVLIGFAAGIAGLGRPRRRRSSR